MTKPDTTILRRRDDDPHQVMLRAVDDLAAQIDALTAERDASRQEVYDLLDVLQDVIDQACDGPDGELDSMALSAYADGMRVLARYGRLTIAEEAGRRVIGQLNERTPDA